MTVNNGVNIDNNSVISHLQFKSSVDETVTVVDDSGTLKLALESEKFAPLTIANNVITFGSNPGGPTLVSYSWV